MIAQLLKPGNRKRDEARARIRSLLAMEALVADTVEISEKDINRIEKGIRSDQDLTEVFLRLVTVGTSASGEGTTFTVHFSKKEGAPVRYVGGDDLEPAATVREVDLRKKFHMRASELNLALGINSAQSKALRHHLGIDQDTSCFHLFEFGKTKIYCFSDNARNKMKDAIAKGADLITSRRWRTRSATAALARAKNSLTRNTGHHHSGPNNTRPALASSQAGSRALTKPASAAMPYRPA